MSTRLRSAGVSLVELMVSLLIGSLLIVGAVTVYMQSRNTYRTNESAARLQETARYALNVIEPDVRMAGYWGMTNRADFIENRGTPAEARQPVDPAAGNCGRNWTVDAVRYLDGRDNGGYDLDCAGSTPVAWADVLIVRRAASLTSALAANRMQIQTNRIRGVVMSDGALPAGFAATPASETRDLIVHAYYIGNPGGTGQFQLRRQTLTNGPSITDEEIVPGVEDLQIQFGIDTSGDGTPDRYVDSNAVPANAVIVSAQIWLVVIAGEREIGFVDGNNYQYANQNRGVLGGDRRRLLVSKTIQIRNSTL